MTFYILLILVYFLIEFYESLVISILLIIFSNKNSDVKRLSIFQKSLYLNKLSKIRICLLNSYLSLALLFFSCLVQFGNSKDTICS